ncbi:MAG: hypothetical protein EU529_12690 [Promethearchaeota archaeon]|nr:MAG: hypothetical protein EU529_12690 [Candidatus Lokiarchaeota archaeon]
MPDEFDFKNYKSPDDFNKSPEGVRYLHDLYLKAVNHPIRREILTVINKEGRISKKELLKTLLGSKIISDESMFNYNIDFLIKAFCINLFKEEKEDEIFYEISQFGEVVNYLE